MTMLEWVQTTLPVRKGFHDVVELVANADGSFIGIRQSELANLLTNAYPAPAVVSLLAPASTNVPEIPPTHSGLAATPLYDAATGWAPIIDDWKTKGYIT